MEERYYATGRRKTSVARVWLTQGSGKVMVNKRAHLRSTKDLQNWIEVYEMFAKLYKFIPW